MSKKQPKKNAYVVGWVDEGGDVNLWYNCDDEISIFDNLDEAKEFAETETCHEEGSFAIFDLTSVLSMKITPRKVSWHAVGSR